MLEEWAIEVEADGSVWETPHPFGRGTLGAVWGELVAIGVQDSYEIKAFATDGSLVRIVRRKGDPRRSTQADRDEYFARLVAIGEDYVLGSVEDELGVEYVQLWALDRGAG